MKKSILTLLFACAFMCIGNVTPAHARQDKVPKMEQSPSVSVTQMNYEVVVFTFENSNVIFVVQDQSVSIDVSNQAKITKENNTLSADVLVPHSRWVYNDYATTLKHYTIYKKKSYPQPVRSIYSYQEYTRQC